MGKRISTRWTCLRAICSEWISWMISFIFWCPQIQHCPAPSPALSSSLLHRLRSSVVGFWLLRMNTRHHVDHCETHLNPEAMVAASKVWVHKCARPPRQTAPRQARKQAAMRMCGSNAANLQQSQGRCFRDGRTANERAVAKKEKAQCKVTFCVTKKKHDNQRTMYCNWVWRCLRSDKHGTKGSTKPCSTQRWRTDQARAFKIALTYANSERNFPLSACCRQKLRYFARLVLAHRVADGKAGELYEPACCKNHLSSIWCA